MEQQDVCETGQGRTARPVPCDPDDLIKSAAVCRRCGGISRHTLWRWVRNRDFPDPAMTLAGIRYWRVRDVDAWLARQASGG